MLYFNEMVRFDCIRKKEKDINTDFSVIGKKENKLTKKQKQKTEVDKIKEEKKKMSRKKR
jgi:hypothetical protein